MKINNCKLCESYDNQKLSGDKSSISPPFCRHTSAAAAAFLTPNHIRDFLAFHLLRGNYEPAIFIRLYFSAIAPSNWCSSHDFNLNNGRERRRLTLHTEIRKEINELAISIIRGSFFVCGEEVALPPLTINVYHFLSTQFSAHNLDEWSMLKISLDIESKYFI